MIGRLLFLLGCAAFWGRAEESASNLLLRGWREFGAAYEAWSAPRFGAAVELFRQAATNTPASITNHYWLGAAQFHLLLCLRHSPGAATNAAAAQAALEGAIATLETAVKLDPRHSESHALLGTLYGMKIGGNWIRGARFGPRVAKHQAAAMEQGADNPRVRYLLGTCQFNTAKKKAERQAALETLLAAEKLFAAEVQQPAGPLEPRWGRSSCLTFIGQTYELLGQFAAAAEYFQKALALHPADHLAREGLARVASKP